MVKIGFGIRIGGRSINSCTILQLLDCCFYFHYHFFSACIVLQMMVWNFARIILTAGYTYQRGILFGLSYIRRILY